MPNPHNKVNPHRMLTLKKLHSRNLEEPATKTSEHPRRNLETVCVCVGGRLIVCFQPLMVMSPTASLIQWCMQVYAW